MQFPLYQTLEANTDLKKTIPSNDLWTKFSKLAPVNVEIVFLLMYHYTQLHQLKLEQVGLKPLKGGKGALVHVDKIPRELQNILLEFMELVNS